MKNILITGANSYVGTSFEKWLSQWPDKYHVDTIDMIDGAWKEKSFEGYDAVFHVAGIAHSETKKLCSAQKQMYFSVNTDLAIQTALKAQKEHVRQFIFMSSMIIYSGCPEEVITEVTLPQPINCYGESKLYADIAITALNSKHFKTAVLRPPMIYGKGCKGNYQRLVTIANKMPVFPIVNNMRSMLYIDNFTQFVKLVIDNDASGIFFPQNRDYVNTSELVRLIADRRKRNAKIVMFPCPAICVSLIKKLPCEIGRLSKKAFSNFVYEHEISEYGWNYQIFSLHESIDMIEGA